MKYRNSLVQTFVALAVVSLTPACGKNSAKDSSADSAPTASDSWTGTGSAAQGRSFDTCRAWIAENHRADYEMHACLSVERVDPSDWENYFNLQTELKGGFGGVLPVGDKQFYILWIPDAWESDMEDRTLIFDLHGSGACSAYIFEDWYNYTSFSRQYAIAALQWAWMQYDEVAGDYYVDDPDGFDSAEDVYANLVAMKEDILAHCPFDDVSFMYYGHSAASAISFEVGIYDAATEHEGGERLVNSYIADSGPGGSDTWYWDDDSDLSYYGTRYWLFCGTADGGTCSGMEKAQDSLEEKNATVDRLYEEEGRGHGIFNKDGSYHSPDDPSDAQIALFDYIDGIAAE